MFKRNVTVTNSHQLSGKDVKKLTRDVKEQFPFLSTSKEKIIPNKTEVLVSKMTNKTVVYTVAGDPVFFEYEGRLYPTVYTLWRFPKMLRTLYTHSEVSPKIVGGADLMLPGVIVPEEGLGEDFEVGDYSTISIPENDQPFAVGFMQTDSESIRANGLKGRGIKLLHHYPDALWMLGSKKTPNAGFKPNRIYPLEVEEEPAEEEDAVAGKLEEVSLESSSASAPGEKTASMDELIDSAFLKALHVRVKDEDLPMDSSAFYSNCMLPSRPRGVDLDFKQSGYKKLSKLIKKMEKRGLIAAKQSKKDDRIMSVNRQHEVYLAFGEELANEVEEDDAPQGETTSLPSKGKQIEVFEVYKSASNLRAVFGQVAIANKDTLFSAEEIYGALLRYAQQEQLSEPQDNATLKLDKLLKSGLYGKKEGVDVGTAVQAKDVYKRLLSKMQLYHKVVCVENGSQVEVVRKGAIKNIHVLAEDRHAGRKFITRVTQLESFAIDPQDFATTLQRLFKCSSTVQKLPGKFETGKEVSFQGNLLQDICKYLEFECGIHPKFIEKTSKMR